MKYIVPLFIVLSVLLLADCSNENTPSRSFSSAQNLEKVYLTKGQQIAAATFATLSNNLQKAMQEGGVTNAVKYCNLSASPLVDSLENKYQAKIRRTSLKTRNVNNQPSERELKQLQAYKRQVELGEQLETVIQEIKENQIAFYAPIHIMPLCQKCHGKIGNTLLKKDYEVIQDLYPNDKAVDYIVGDWRGMWSITLPK